MDSGARSMWFATAEIALRQIAWSMAGIGRKQTRNFQVRPRGKLPHIIASFSSERAGDTGSPPVAPGTCGGLAAAGP
jgi:hypothetical protein